jgi:hypothetical protein
MRARRQRKGDSKSRSGATVWPTRSTQGADRRAVLALFAMLGVAYYPALGAGFTNWDDDRFITNNPLFQGSILGYVGAAFTRVQFQAYHPLHLLSYLPDRLLWPHHATGFHALNLALYATALALGYFLLRKTVAVLPALGAMLLVGLAPSLWRGSSDARTSWPCC